MTVEEIEIFNESDLNLDLGHLCGFTSAARTMLRVDLEVELGGLNIVLLHEKEHTLLNINYLGHEYPTDILTFEYVEESTVNGEIYVNAEILVENASEYDVTVVNELCRLIIHGLLHLCGQDDQSFDDRAKMTELEDKYLGILEIKGFM